MEHAAFDDVPGRCMLQWSQDARLETAIPKRVAEPVHLVFSVFQQAQQSNLSAHLEESNLAVIMGVGIAVSVVLGILLRPAPAMQAEVPQLEAESSTLKPVVKNVPTADEDKADMSPLHIYMLTSINLAYGFALALQGLLVAPLEAQRLWPESASQAVGAFAAMAAIAQLIGPEVGHISDTYRSSLGRRRPMLIVSVTLVASLTIGLWYFSLVRARFSYVATLLLQQIFWNVVMSTQAGLAPDVVPEGRLGFSGAASAANVLIGAFLGFVAMANLTFLEYHYFYSIQAAFLLSCCVVVCVLADEKSSLDQAGDDCKTVSQWLNRVVEHYSFDWREHPDFSMLLLTKTLYCASVVVKAFLFFFCQDTFKLPSLAEEENLLSKCAVGAEVGAAISAIVTMLFVDSGSSRALKAVTYGSAWMGVMWIVPSLVGYRAEQVGAKNSPAWSISLIPWFIFGTTIWGFGQGAYLAGDQALSLHLLPDPDQASRYLAFSSICAFVGTAIGGLAAGALLALLGGGQKKGYAYPGYLGIFTLAVILSWILAGFSTLIRVRDAPDTKLDADAAASQKLDNKG